ncbi:MAG: DUF3368 domain-containing protein [Chitinophagales bacterium]|nr:DUF3368 domain-containing protein [Chitinophagales bacterium]
MPNAVIADTSCLILLTKINELHLLPAVYTSAYTSPEIAKEFGRQLPDWLNIQSVGDKELLQKLIVLLDIGEASAIALSYEIKDSILVLDDLMARRVAQNMKVPFTGTFGVILKAKQCNVVSSVKPILEKVRTTDFYFSESIYETVLKAAGEW